MAAGYAVGYSSTPSCEFVVFDSALIIAGLAGSNQASREEVTRMKGNRFVRGRNQITAGEVQLS